MKYLQTDSLPPDLSFHLKKIAKRILRWESRRILKKYKPKIIIILGSVGKTLTKESIYLSLSKNFFVRKSEKSFTAEVGIPLAIIGCPIGVGTIIHWMENILFGLKVAFFKTRYPEWLILEIDNDKPGDLKKVSELLSPDIVVMTAIGKIPAHIETFYSVEEFLSGMRKFVSSLPEKATIIYNADDAVSENLLKGSDQEKISCGIERGDIQGSKETILYGTIKGNSVPTGMSFGIKWKEETYSLTILESLGIQNQYAALLAFAVGIKLGLSHKKLIASLGKVSALPGRMRIINGLKDTTLIDDSYNSSPEALSQAISVLSGLKVSGRKLAVIGDMLELGRYTAEEHKQAAIELQGVAGEVLTVGLRARKISEELHQRGFKNAVQFDTAENAGRHLQTILQPGDVVLIKGSQAMRLEKVVEEVMRYPQDKKKMLVRQEREWQDR